MWFKTFAKDVGLISTVFPMQAPSFDQCERVKRGRTADSNINSQCLQDVKRPQRYAAHYRVKPLHPGIFYKGKILQRFIRTAKNRKFCKMTNLSLAVP